MKKILQLISVTVFLTISFAFNAHSGGLMTMLSTGDEFTQGCALALLSKSIENGDVDAGNAHLLLCGEAYNLALDTDTTTTLKPMESSLWEKVDYMIEYQGLNVYLCTFVLFNPPYNNLINMNNLHENVKVITKSVINPYKQIHVNDVTSIINEPGMQVMSYGGRNR